MGLRHGCAFPKSGLREPDTMYCPPLLMRKGNPMARAKWLNIEVASEGLDGKTIRQVFTNPAHLVTEIKFLKFVGIWQDNPVTPSEITTSQINVHRAGKSPLAVAKLMLTRVDGDVTFEAAFLVTEEQFLELPLAVCQGIKAAIAEYIYPRSSLTRS